MSEFTYGEIVEVRDVENGDWFGPRVYLGSITLPSGDVRHYVVKLCGDGLDFSGNPVQWKCIRKPAPVLTIEERLESLEAAIQKLHNP